LKIHVASIVISLAMAASSAAAQSDFPEQDTSGKGAILCAYDIYHSVRAATKACHWEHTPADDAIDKALLDLEVFIRANSSTPAPIDTMEWIKRRNAETPIPPGMAEQCTGFDPENRGSSMAFIWMIHTQDAETVRAGMQDTLSIPREPLYNPCL
jgi:hypothetical protein